MATGAIQTPQIKVARFTGTTGATFGECGNALGSLGITGNIICVKPTTNMTNLKFVPYAYGAQIASFYVENITVGTRQKGIEVTVDIYYI